MILRTHWRELRNARRGEEIVVVGNGPSATMDGPSVGARYGGRLAIGANSASVRLFGHHGFPLSIVAAWDPIPAREVMDLGSDPLCPVRAPQLACPTGTLSTAEDEERYDGRDVIDMGPPSGGMPTDEIPTGHDPFATGVLGNLSGILAVYLAWCLGAEKILLHGMDVGGIAAQGGEDVELSACPASWAGYSSHRIPVRSCVRASGDWFLPMGWAGRLGFWRAFTRWLKEEQGVEVLRTAARGCMDWIPVV